MGYRIAHLPFSAVEPDSQPLLRLCAMLPLEEVTIAATTSGVVPAQEFSVSEPLPCSTQLADSLAARSTTALGTRMQVTTTAELIILRAASPRDKEVIIARLTDARQVLTASLRARSGQARPGHLTEVGSEDLSGQD